MKTKFILLFMTAFMSGCFNGQDRDKTAVSDVKNLTLKSALQSEGQFVNLRAYTFQNGFYDNCIKDIAVDGNDFSITAPNSATLYFISTVESSDLVNLHPGETSLKCFLSLHTERNAVHTGTSAPEFFSGICTSTGASAEERDTIHMLRSTARLDFDMTHDSKIKVSRIIVPEASKTTSIFADSVPSFSADKVRYERTYDTVHGDVLIDQFRIYESNTPVKVTIIGTYDTTPTTIQVLIPTVRRNMVYRIKIKNLGTVMGSSFTVSPWEANGNTISA